ncbi:hypothetical protein LOTGIDRAFT_151243 [Lottia gigantea]|uniref:Protein Abitram n=1 Tax=Lottia gigantea TaxID=225164 RepID=V3ZIE7_LOTGI|nr:hypothetical protein LOTGIDRAFT_151243 [Lottia gigantea]ESO82090.1 hypothetical protein LOTGIDRAFT_151243 [Lottia gigantea]
MEDADDFDNGIPGFEFDENDWPTTNDKPKPFVDRYFSRFYRTDLNGKTGEDQCVLCHSNKICLVTLAKSHPVIVQKKTVSSINFEAANGINRLDNKVSGKGKRGAQWVKANSILCKIKCTDETEYLIVSCVRGMLIEINENILDNSNLIAEKPEDAGFIAVIMIKRNEFDREMKQLLSQEKYQGIVKKRLEESEKQPEIQESGISKEMSQVS